MADSVSIKINKDLRPAYYDDFHCLAADCRFSCCKAWRISFDKKDYLSLKRQKGTEDLNNRLEQGVRRLRDKESNYYGEFDMSGGDCPLLREDGLCALQIEKDHAALPQVCRAFPRAMAYLPEYLERSLSPACEGVLELLWNLPDGVDFVSDPLPREEWKIYTYEESASPLWGSFEEIRELCVDILQDRRRPLPERLLLLGMALKPLADGDPDVPAWLDRARPVNRRTSLVLGGAALLLGLYALLMPVPLLWRLYDRVAWIGTSLDTMMTAGRPANPVFFFLGWTLADQCAFSSHMLLLSLFQLGRLLFSRKAAPRPQAAQPI